MWPEIPFTAWATLALATWRVASLLSDEAGVYDIFEKIRTLAGIKYSEVDGDRYATNEVGKNILCVWCLSLFVGGLWALLYLLLGNVTVFIAMPFAFSAATVWIDKRVWLGHKRN